MCVFWICHAKINYNYNYNLLCKNFKLLSGATSQGSSVLTLRSLKMTLLPSFNLHHCYCLLHWFEYTQLVPHCSCTPSFMHGSLQLLEVRALWDEERGSSLYGQCLKFMADNPTHSVKVSIMPFALQQVQVAIKKIASHEEYRVPVTLTIHNTEAII